MGYKRELLRDKVGRLTQWHSWAPMEVNLARGNECVAFLWEFFFFFATCGGFEVVSPR